MALAVLGAAATVGTVAGQATRQLTTPVALLGRVAAVHRIASSGGGTLGALAGGFLAAASGANARGLSSSLSLFSRPALCSAPAPRAAPPRPRRSRPDPLLARSMGIERPSRPRMESTRSSGKVGPPRRERRQPARQATSDTLSGIVTEPAPVPRLLDRLRIAGLVQSPSAEHVPAGLEGNRGGEVPPGPGSAAVGGRQRGRDPGSATSMLTSTLRTGERPTKPGLPGSKHRPDDRVRVMKSGKPAEPAGLEERSG